MREIVIPTDEVNFEIYGRPNISGFEVSTNIPYEPALVERLSVDGNSIFTREFPIRHNLLSDHGLAKGVFFRNARVDSYIFTESNGRFDNEKLGEYNGKLMRDIVSNYFSLYLSTRFAGSGLMLYTFFREGKALSKVGLRSFNRLSEDDSLLVLVDDAPVTKGKVMAVNDVIEHHFGVLEAMHKKYGMKPITQKPWHVSAEPFLEAVVSELQSKPLGKGWIEPTPLLISRYFVKGRLFRYER